jgi:hypothetical protein
VFDELDIRIHSSIERAKDGTFKVSVSRHGRTEVAKGFLQSELDAVKWRDGDVGASMIKSILSKIP